MNIFKITGLGPLRVYDEEGRVIMEGQIREAVFAYEAGYKEHVKAAEPKKCPNCGAELK